MFAMAGERKGSGALNFHEKVFTRFTRSSSSASNEYGMAEEAVLESLKKGLAGSFTATATIVPPNVSSSENGSSTSTSRSSVVQVKEEGDDEEVVECAHIAESPLLLQKLATAASIKPLEAMSTRLVEIYQKCNPKFAYEHPRKLRRLLTEPADAKGNEGNDNVDGDLIMKVGDKLFRLPNSKRHYVVKDSLGKGAFGQVVKCVCSEKKKMFAVKVIKNKPAYFNQALFELHILHLLKPSESSFIVKFVDHFIYKNHMCIVFEMLSANLYELIQQNNFRGLSLALVRRFVGQVLAAMSVLESCNIIHCDLKPENILLKDLNTPDIKIIDFGSAGVKKKRNYMYIQSRFYRAPEVMVGTSFSSGIDMWSLGCIAAELFLGLPLFAGSCEYDQIRRILEMQNEQDSPLPPSLVGGKNAKKYFKEVKGKSKETQYFLKTVAEYTKSVGEVPDSKKYFTYDTLQEIIRFYPVKSGLSSEEAAKEHKMRVLFADLVCGMLNIDPEKRWTVRQAQSHPFLTGKDTEQVPFKPDPQLTKVESSQPDVDPKDLSTLFEKYCPERIQQARQQAQQAGWSNGTAPSPGLSSSPPSQPSSFQNVVNPVGSAGRGWSGLSIGMRAASFGEQQNSPIAPQSHPHNTPAYLHPASFTVEDAILNSPSWPMQVGPECRPAAPVHFDVGSVGSSVASSNPNQSWGHWHHLASGMLNMHGSGRRPSSGSQHGQHIAGNGNGNGNVNGNSRSSHSPGKYQVSVETPTVSYDVADWDPFYDESELAQEISSPQVGSGPSSGGQTHGHGHQWSPVEPTGVGGIGSPHLSASPVRMGGGFGPQGGQGLQAMSLGAVPFHPPHNSSQGHFPYMQPIQAGGGFSSGPISWSYQNMQQPIAQPSSGAASSAPRGIPVPSGRGRGRGCGTQAGSYEGANGFGAAKRGGHYSRSAPSAGWGGGRGGSSNGGGRGAMSPVHRGRGGSKGGRQQAKD